MASVTKQRDGTFLLRVALGGRQRAIRMGRMNRTEADSLRLHIGCLERWRKKGHPLEGATVAWLETLGPDLRDKLADIGLVDAQPCRLLGEFLDAYIASRGDVKPRTRTNYEYARRELVGYFGAERPLTAITPGDADEFRRNMKTRATKPLGDNTIRRHCGRAKEFFRAAVRKRLVKESPFVDMKDCRVRSNRERDYFLTRVDAQKVLDACPTNEWKLIFALSRFGGLRCPSETLRLTWGDVDLSAGRMTVVSPKTEHHVGHESRVVPIFPELRPIIEKAYNEAQAAVGDDAVPSPDSPLVMRARGAGVNLRTQLERIVNRAGLESWPKLFHNLRATRQTELAADFPQHVVCQWIGNSEAVAMEHYLRVTDADFDKALQCDDAARSRSAREPRRTAAHVDQNGTSALESPEYAQVCARSVPPRGVEPRFSG